MKHHRFQNGSKVCISGDLEHVYIVKRYIPHNFAPYGFYILNPHPQPQQFRPQYLPRPEAIVAEHEVLSEQEAEIARVLGS